MGHSNDSEPQSNYDRPHTTGAATFRTTLTTSVEVGVTLSPPSGVGNRTVRCKTRQPPGHLVLVIALASGDADSSARCARSRAVAPFNASCSACTHRTRPTPLSISDCSQPPRAPARSIRSASWSECSHTWLLTGASTHRRLQLEYTKEPRPDLPERGSPQLGRLTNRPHRLCSTQSSFDQREWLQLNASTNAKIHLSALSDYQDDSIAAVLELTSGSRIPAGVIHDVMRLGPSDGNRQRACHLATLQLASGMAQGDRIRQPFGETWAQSLRLDSVFRLTKPGDCPSPSL